MRKTLLLLVSLSVSTLSLGQTIRLNGYGGYTFRDRFPLGGTYGFGGINYYYTEGEIKESAHFGGGLEFEFRPNMAVEIYYQNQPTTGSIRFSNWDATSGDVSVNYLMLGGLRYAPFSDKVKGFGGLLLGAAWADSNYGSSTKFAWGGRLGLFITPSDRFGIRLGAQLLSPVQGAGGGLYFGTGGASAGVSTYSTIYQFGFFGGISIGFPQGGGGSRPTPMGQ